MHISKIYFFPAGKGFFSSWKKARVNDWLTGWFCIDGSQCRLQLRFWELLSLRKYQEAAHKVIRSQG
ncbi:unnamed protein product [Brassica rapa subsp. trilocularis]